MHKSFLSCVRQHRACKQNIYKRFAFQFGTQFYEKVYNETVNIVEVEEGLDGETFFLYVFLGAGVVLLLVIGQQFLYSVGKKRVGGGKKNLQLETGTKKKDDIDYEWVPSHLLKTYSE